MIRLVFGFVFRAMVDLGLVLLASGAVFLVVAYRIGRRFLTPAPDKLDRVSAQLAQLLAIGLVASRSAARSGAFEPELDDLGELDDDDLTDEEREQSRDFWRSVTV